MRSVIVHSTSPSPSQERPVRPERVPGYTLTRNNAVAQHIAELIGGRVCEPTPDLNRAYFVPDAPLLRTRANELGIQEEDDLFGGVVDVRLHHDKAILHPLVSKEAVGNKHYSKEFTQLVVSAVLPGFTAFAIDDATQAFDILRQQGHEVRCKDPAQEGGNGQCVISNEYEWAEFVSKISPVKIADAGIVLEPNIVDAATLSVGQIYLSGRYYSYHGHQRQTISLSGTSTYGGTTLTMVRGDFLALAKLLDSGPTKEAVEQASIVNDAYSIYEPVVSRTNFDIVQGRSKDGAILSGVVDQSLRIGGASPAELLAIKALEADPALVRAVAEVAITWDPSSELINPDDVIFFNNSQRRDVARLLDAD